jgi:hypothetical protein
MARKHGLKSPQPIMCTNRDSGSYIYMFRSGSKYYLWNLIEDNIWEVLTSMDLVNIVTELAKPKLGSLKVAELPQLSASFRGWKMIVLH